MFKVINDGKLPTRGSKYSACVDLYASEDKVIGGGDTELVGLGVCIDSFKLLDYARLSYIHMGGTTNPTFDDNFMRAHYLQLMLRSSLSKHLIIANGVGVVDLDYEDEIKIRLHNPRNKWYKIKKGDRIAQVTLLEHKGYLFGIETEDERSGGFGSTGKD